MNKLMKTFRKLTFISFVCTLPLISNSQPRKNPDFIPIGIYLGDLTLGERVITFTRFLPFSHPETKGHDYPTATLFTKSEVEIFMHLGEQLGWNLYATLWRHPATPVDQWMYPEFPELPVEKIKNLPVVESDDSPPLKGLKAVCFLNDQPVAFIMDTRGITLEERGMKRSTSSGVDMSREEFFSRLSLSQKEMTGSDAIIVYKLE